MITLIVPEAAPWVQPLRESLSGPVYVVDLSRSPIGQALRVARRLWVRGRTDRAMRISFMTRQIMDEVMARLLPKATGTVIAPSLAGERVFSVARTRGIETMLVEDLPDLAKLHADLDEAAAQHPQTPWLTRFRAADRWVERQRREVALADVVFVRGQFSRQLRESSGRAPETIRMLPTSHLRRGTHRLGRLVLFAGLAAARNGIFEAVEATRRAGLTLLVRTGEGSEHVFLRGHHHVREATTVEREHFAGVGAVLAPAWCECSPPEVERAASYGVPIIATDRAAGWVSRYAPVERGNVASIVAALQDVMDPTQLAA